MAVINNPKQESGIFASIISKEEAGEHVFYKSQQIGEEEFSKPQKISILEELYREKPRIFLERYHRLIESEYLPMFDEADPEQKFYLDQIHKRRDKKSGALIRNRRYLAMQKLQTQGTYFSNEEMREREPYLFDIMVGQYMDDEDKLHLRPTIEIIDSNRSEFSRLLEQFEESQRVSDRRERFLQNYRDLMDESDRTDRFMSHVGQRTIEADEEERQMCSDFQMEFDSSDEEGREAEKSRLKALGENRARRHCAKNDATFVMRRYRAKMDQLEKEEKCKSSAAATVGEADETADALSSLKVTKRRTEDGQMGEEEVEEWSSGDEDESRPTGFTRDQLYSEFVSIMEERFLEGKDTQFFDYSQIDAGHDFDQMREQDMEDAYFDAEESD